MGWKCQELPSLTLEESSPRVIQHLPRAKRASTRNSSRRENPRRRSGSTQHVAGGGRGWEGDGGGRWPGLRPSRAAAEGAVRWGASSRCANAQGPPITHSRGVLRVGHSPTEPELRLGLTWRPAFLSSKSSSIDYIWINSLA